MGEIRQVTNHLNFRMTGNGEIVVDHDAVHSIDRHAERLSNKRSSVACRPDFHTAWNKFIAYLQSGLREIGGARASAE